MPSDDDLTISNEDRLFRRVPRNWIVWDDNEGVASVSSAAFSDSSDGSGMSVSIESVMDEKGLSVEDILRDYEGFGMVAIAARLAREKGQSIIRKPTVKDPAHGEVIGKKRGSVKKAFKRGAEWIVCPIDSRED